MNPHEGIHQLHLAALLHLVVVADAVAVDKVLELLEAIRVSHTLVHDRIAWKLAILSHGLTPVCDQVPI